VLFLAGCPLRCIYCQNPDTWSERDGAVTTVDELMVRIRRYQPMFRRTGGGVTISGGEPLLQPAFTGAVFRSCRLEGISTALDTSGALGARASDELLLDTDLVLLDIKAYQPRTYAQVTGGGDITPTLQFARRLAALERPVHLRFVLVPGVNDGLDEVGPIADLAASLSNIARVDVLPVHTLAAGKYAALGIPYPLAELPPVTAEQAESVRAQFRARGLTVS
jgi:pyruvate formate lyase activating enzyme